MSSDYTKYHPYTIIDSVSLSKVSKMLKLCELSKNLMISIYLIENNKFLFNNKVFEKTILGGNTNKLIREGWKFWFSVIDPNESTRIRNKVRSFLSTPFSKENMILKYHITDFYGKKMYIKHEILIYKLKKQLFAINYFFDISGKEQLHQYFNILGGTSKKNTLFLEKTPLNLSSREAQVVKLIANGFSSKQIANQLFISNHTAIWHRKNLIKKFGVKNTAQLIKEASLILEL